MNAVSDGRVNMDVHVDNRNPAHPWLRYPGLKTVNLCNQLLQRRIQGGGARERAHPRLRKFLMCKQFLSAFLCACAI